MAVAARSGEACEGAGAQSLEVRAGSGQVFSGGDDSLFVRAIVAVHRSRRGGKYIILRGEPQYNSLPLSPNHQHAEPSPRNTLNTHDTARRDTREIATASQRHGPRRFSLYELASHRRRVRHAFSRPLASATDTASARSLAVRWP